MKLLPHYYHITKFNLLLIASDLSHWHGEHMDISTNIELAKSIFFAILVWTDNQ